MAELRSLKVKRGQFKSQLKRFRNFLETSEEHEEQEIREKLGKLEQVWEKFQNIQYAIRETRKQGVPADENEDEQFEKIETEEDEQEAEFEDNYFKLVTCAKERLGQTKQ